MVAGLGVPIFSFYGTIIRKEKEGIYWGMGVY